MFDLFRSRAKAVRILLGAMLTIVALSMLVYLIPGFGTPSVDPGDQVIAEVGKATVTVQEVDQLLRNQLQNQRLPPDLAATLIPQIVDQAISDRAVAYEAEQLGFRVSDHDLANTLRSMPFGKLPPDQYRQMVEQQMGMTVPDFENNTRLLMYENSVLTLAQEGVVVTPAEVEAEYHKRTDKIKVDYIGFDAAKLAKEAKPTPEELNTYFRTYKNLFTMPETRSVQLIVADQAKVGESIQISDAQIQNYYNSHRDQYRTTERVHARHILLSTANKSKEEAPKIQAQAEDLLKQIKAGGDFAELAKKYSQDPGSAVKGGDLGWVVRGQTVKNFEESAFSLKPKEISNVIPTEYGFHIIQVLEKEPAHVQALDEVKTQIVGTLRNQTVFDRMQQLADQAHEALVKAPHNAEQIASQLNLLFVNADKYATGGVIPELGPDPQLAATLGTLKPGEVSQVFQSGSKLAVAVLTSIHPRHPAEFDEAEAQVREQFGQVTGVQLVKEKSKKAAELLKANGGDLKAAAKAVGLPVTSTDFFARTGAAEGIGSASLLGRSFDLPAGSPFGPVDVGTQTIIGKIVERQNADMSKFPQERDQIVLQLKGKKAMDRQSLLEDSILIRLIQSGKVKKHQQVIDRLMSRYRS
jgi:peptidyl-prolyl cis-trans isomerase D